jgi:hypothetical protein
MGMSQHQKMIEALEQLKAAVVNVNEAWEGIDELGSFNYPFEKSFDEEAVDIIEWIECFTEELIRKLPA